MTCTEQYYFACIAFCLFCVTFIAFVLVIQCACHFRIKELLTYLLTYCTYSARRVSSSSLLEIDLTLNNNNSSITVSCYEKQLRLGD